MRYPIKKSIEDKLNPILVLSLAMAPNLREWIKRVQLTLTSLVLVIF